MRSWLAQLHNANGDVKSPDKRPSRREVVNDWIWQEFKLARGHHSMVIYVDNDRDGQRLSARHRCASKFTLALTENSDDITINVSAKQKTVQGGN